MFVNIELKMTLETQKELPEDIIIMVVIEFGKACTHQQGYILGLKNSINLLYLIIWVLG